jgi:hypothetical protein
MYEEEVENYHCGSCRHYNNCKRIDHETIQFAQPWFKSYDRHQFSGVICSDFDPAEWHVYACETWNGFEYYWPRYVEQWLPYGNTSILVYFTLNGDTSIRYGVPLLDFVYGTMVDNGVLKAVEKMYYKQTRTGFGYKLIKEKIDGITIQN